MFKRTALTFAVASALSFSASAADFSQSFIPVDAGITNPSTVATISLYLKARNTDQLEALVKKTSTPGSDHFREFLSVRDFADRYGASDDQIENIRAALKAAGITVNEIFANKLVIRATGTVTQFNTFFSTQIHDYQDSEGHRYRHPATKPTIPASLSATVIHVAGLSDKPFARSMHISQRPATLQADHLDVSLAATTTNKAGYLTTADVASLYNVQPLYADHVTGKGMTIGIMTLANFVQKDAYDYWAAIGLSVAPTRITEVQVDGGTGTNGAEETTLDVQQSGGLAPDAKIVVYEAPNTSDGFLDVFNKAASDNVADTLSLSWGSPEIANDPNSLTAMHQAFLELAVQGSPVFVASGDSGAYDINNYYSYPTCTKTLTVDSPASDPLVTAAGGTTLPGAIKLRRGTITIAHEQPWAWDYLQPLYSDIYYSSLFPVGGGGGVSLLNPTPSYQTAVSGVLPSATNQDLVCQGQDLAPLPGNFAGRNVPDVSLNADPETGYLLIQGGAAIAYYGGTSFVAPQLNGIASLLTQKAHRRLGFLNPQLYAAYQQFGYGSNSPFNAISTGTNLYWQGAMTYNPAVGLGTLNVGRLAKILASGND